MIEYRNFLKPDLIKILLTVGFLIVSFFYVYTPNYSDADKVYYEFPIFSYIDNYGIFHGFPFIYSGEGQILISGLVIDLIFWYLVSCGAIAIYQKIRKKYQ